MDERSAEWTEEPPMSRVSDDLAMRFDQILARDGAALNRVAGSYEANPQLREDLFQEICLAIWQALPRFRGESSERTFVFRIAHNRGLSHCWRRKAMPRTMPEDAEPQARGPDPEAEAAQAQGRARLLDAVRSLPLGLRQVVTLTLEGLSTKEVSDVLEISENNVAVRLSRARDALRTALGSKEVAP
jgi:RNA polymerase sigma-70 factor, ECF subfamily